MTHEELENFKRMYESIDDVSYDIYRFLRQNKPELFEAHDYLDFWEIEDGKLYIHVKNCNDGSRCLSPVPLEELINEKDITEYLINNF